MELTNKMNCVLTPNLPGDEVSAVSVNAESKSYKALRSLGIAVVPVFKSPALSGSTASHADLQLLHAGGNVIFAASCCDDTVTMLKTLKFDVRIAENELSSVYPGDCALNSLIIEDKIICSPSAQDPAVTAWAKSEGRETVPVKQGYTRCSCAVVSSSSIITADKGIASAAQKAGFDVLIISAGNIDLEGYDCGFIGGCCGLASPDVLFTAGNIKKHPDGDDIRAFVRNYGVYIEPLHSGTLTDIGGIIPLLEK